MKVSKVVTRFSTAPSDQNELRRVARSLGGELPRQQVETLREFRAAMARTPIGSTTDVSVDQTSYAVGYVDGMLDVTAEYESVIAEAQRNDELSADVARGIQIAVGLFQHMATSPYASDSALNAIAGGILGDQSIAAEAVDLWSRESRAAGLISELHEAQSDTSAVPDAVPTAVPVALGSMAHRVPEEFIWGDEPTLIDEPVDHRPHAMRAITEPLSEYSMSDTIEIDPLSS